MTDLNRDLFQRARAVPIADVAGVSLFRAGKTQRGECPVSGCGKGKRGGGPFWVMGEKWGCFACKGEDWSGDVVDLEAELTRCTPREAAERLAGPSAPDFAKRAPRPATAPARQAVDDPRRLAWVPKVVSSGVPLAGTPAGEYLSNRGIKGPLVNPVFHSSRVLFHPAVPYAWDGAEFKWRCAPAMVMRVETPSGFTGGIHCTYLQRRGPERRWAKSALDPAKRMWGRQKDADGRPGGCWLIGPDGDGPAVVGEGAESALSAAILEGKSCRVLAALSLGRLQGGWMLDRYGRLPTATIAADPETPPLTWPGMDEVVIAVDRDMRPITRKARRATGGTYDREIDSDERARICAGLAEQAWKRAGANRVRVIAPGAGEDFNDKLMGRVGQ